MELSDHNFNRFRNMIYRNVGIHLHEGKKDLVRARLGKRLRRTGCQRHLRQSGADPFLAEPGYRAACRLDLHRTYGSTRRIIGSQIAA